ncbi:hypothetical protein [Pseudoalteromonas sp. JB197]|uniref:hypothetical protein n=1 Tax=Pseudoalteromonas sp. JB197 TaxID=1434839 RepID=UPI000B35BECA|nr:hypothetical protein [Pseudoalteromonas sp. JB197]PCC14258.1 hypothetical protein CIK86_13975 [Pseudoalteromonas sp. JB197]
MNLPLNKGKVLSCLEKVLSNITGIKVVTATNDELRVCNFLKGIYQQLAHFFSEILIRYTQMKCIELYCLGEV